MQTIRLDYQWRKDPPWELSESIVIRLLYTEIKVGVLSSEDELAVVYKSAANSRSHFRNARTIFKKSEKFADIVLEPYADATIERVPPYVTLSLMSGERTLESITLSWKVGHFCKRFLTNPEAPVLNALAFGLTGSGKSTFINTVYAMMRLDNVVNEPMALVGSHSERTTTDLSPFRLARLEKDAQQQEVAVRSRLRLWDTWGIETETQYAGSVFDDVVLGRVDKVEMEVANTPRLRDWQGRPAMAQFEKHVLIFFIPAVTAAAAVASRTSRDDAPPGRGAAAAAAVASGGNVPAAADEGHMSRALRHYIHRCTALKRRCILLLSKIDEAIPAAKEDPFNPEVERLLNKAAAHYSIPKMYCFAMVGYCNQTERVWKLEVNVFNIVNRLFELASSATSIGTKSVRDLLRE
jgi:hypothetical protein